MPVEPKLKDMRPRLITLGEVWDILNMYNVPCSEAAQELMVDVSRKPRETWLTKIRRKLNGIKNM